MPFMTGDDPGATTTCHEINIPDDIYFRMAVRGALLELADARNWEQLGSATPDEYATLAQTMIDAFNASSC